MIHRKWCPITWFNTLRPRQHGRYFPDDSFRCIFLSENIWIAINISLSFVPKGPIDNIPSLVQIMAWRRSGDKPLSEPMMVSLLTHICVTRPQWVNSLALEDCNEIKRFKKGDFQTDVSDSGLKCLLWNCPQMNATWSNCDQSILVQIMAWCRQATSHYLNQCWPWLMSLYGTRPQWVNPYAVNQAN